MKKYALLIFAWLLIAAPCFPFHAAYAQSLQVISPADGTEVTPGQTIKIVLKAAPAVKTAMITVEKPLLPAEETSSPMEFSLTIPTDIPEGSYHFRAMAQAEGEFVQSAPVGVSVKWPQKLVSIKTDPSSLYFATIGENTSLKALGTFANGAEIDITRAPLTIYYSSNPYAATVSLSGVVTSLGAGKTTVTIENNKVTDSIPVTVGNTQGRINYDLRLAIDTPLKRIKGGSYDATIGLINHSNIPLSFVKVTSATLNDRPAKELPPSKLNVMMEEGWVFHLEFPPAPKQEDSAKFVIHAVLSALPENYRGQQEFNSSYDFDIPH